MIRTKILIAIPSNIGREVLSVPFVLSMQACVAELRYLEGIDVDIHYFAGLRIDAVRNQSVEYAIAEKYDVMIFLDDDMIFPLNMLTEMHDHWLDGELIISGLYGSKSVPHHYFCMPDDGKQASTKDWLINVPDDIYYVKTLATGCLWIDLKVFEEISRPFFLLRMDKFGRITQTEDCFFGSKCHRKGIKMMLDATLKCQHLKMVGYPNVLRPTIETSKYPIKCLQIHPKSGYLITDGIDECRHDRQAQLNTNKGEESLFICRDCGLVGNHLNLTSEPCSPKEIDEMERLTNA